MTFRLAHDLSGDHRHVMSGGGYVLGRSTSGEGAVEELSISTLLAPYVLKAGDTMTGTLILDPGAAADVKHYLAATRGLVIRPTATSGGWARGMWVAKNSDGSDIAGVGFNGTNEAVTSFAVGFGSTWYSSPIFTIDQATGQSTLNTRSTSANALALDSTASTYLSFKRSGARKGYIQSDPAALYIVQEENLPITFYTNNTSRLSIPADAAGIQFPASQAASSNANTIDDYEEGSFTPTDASGAGLSITGTLYYTKIGRLVHVTGTVTYPATASGAQAIMGGLPYTSANTNWMGGTCAPFTSTGVDVGWMINAASTQMYAYDPDANAVKTNANLTGATIYALNFTYHV